MKTGVGLFASSMLFAVVTAIVYGFATRDVVGVMLLGMTSLALFVIALYIRVAEGESGLRADDPASSPADGAGDVVGTFALESYWPAAAALCVGLGIAGITFLPGLSSAMLLVALVAGALVVRLLVREST